MVSAPAPAAGSEAVTDVGDPIYEPSAVTSPASSAEPQAASGLQGGVAGGSLVGTATLEATPQADAPPVTDGTIVSAGADEERRIPLSIATAIAICAGFTVLFGLWPSPIVNFAHAATLLLH